MASSSLEPRRPRLLPQNRKLRHLKGLSLRNLCFDPPLLQTTDDARITSSNPKKLAVVREAADSLLHPSLSSGNLRRDSIRAASSEQARPSPARRVSLGSAHASPSVRQKKLAEVVDAAVGDVFFSLHVPGQEDNIQSPIYISEVGEKSAVSSLPFFHLIAWHSPLTAARTSTFASLTLPTPNPTSRDHAPSSCVFGPSDPGPTRGSLCSRS